MLFIIISILWVHKFHLPLEIQFQVAVLVKDKMIYYRRHVIITFVLIVIGTNVNLILGKLDVTIAECLLKQEDEKRKFAFLEINNVENPVFSKFYKESL